MAFALVSSVFFSCGTFLVAFRWWLDARPKSQPVDTALAERVQQLEAWRTRTEMGKLR